MAGQFYEVLIVIEGQQSRLNAISPVNAVEHGFSFNAIMPMPAELDFDLNSSVEDGYDALYAEWKNVSGRRMLKDAAERHGFPFPLANREQIITCIKELGEHGENMLAHGELFKSNLERFGHGHRSAWRKANWGVECEIEELIVNVDGDSARIAFSLCSSFPKKMLTAFSKSNSDLSFLVSCVSESKKFGKKYLVKNGREVEKIPATDDELFDSICAFRKGFGIKWLDAVAKRDDCDTLVEMSPTGRIFFKGTQIALRFALRRLIEGESIERLAGRITELNSGHLELLASLMKNKEVARFI